MTLTSQQQNDTGWLDDGFGQLDLSGFPSLNPLPAEPRDDSRFARSWQDTDFSRSAGALRSFVSSPDADALERVGNETGNQNFLADVRDQRAERIVLEFKFRNPAYLPTDENFRSMVTTLAFNALPPSEQGGDPRDLVDVLADRGHWTVENLQRVYDALNREGLLEVESGTARNLTEREKLRVSRMAQRGQLDAALGEFLRCALDGEEPDLEMLNDPRYTGACNAAVFFVFSATQLDYQPTPEREAYMLRYAGARPLTIPLLQQAWRSCLQHERRADRSELIASFEPTQPTPKDIDALEDNDVDRLYHDSLRAARRAPGILA
jgi:hypothetical protein